VSEQSTVSIFAERLRVRREEAGFTQQELSRLCGFGVTQISRYERGLQGPTLAGLAKIARILGISIDYLAGVTDDPHGNLTGNDLTGYEREVLETYRRDGWRGIAQLGLDKLAK
jgi:transcriptional regulator with XRE-family HTH domain